jgi:hypothetical protein
MDLRSSGADHYRKSSNVSIPVDPNIEVPQLVGALLSREYRFTAKYVGIGVLGVAIGALLAVPLSKAGLFSRSRNRPYRTDSMTLQSQVTWSSHLVRRVLFMLALPLAGMAYTVASPGGSVHYMAPILFAALMGFLSNLATAECLGLLMETYDTSDLQPGANSTHRPQSVATIVRRRRTAYTSYPRVSAGFFAAQTIGYLLAAAATAIGGVMARRLGAQLSTGITAAVLLGITVLLSGALWRFKNVPVLPAAVFGAGEYELTQPPGSGNRQGTMEKDWKPVVVGTPSGRIRRMSVLEEGKLSRWTEIRRLNRLIED